MLFKIFKFEIRYWLTRPMPYIFMLINAIIVFSATISDNITIGASAGSVHKNAPFFVEQMYAIMTIFMGLLMITAFLNSAAARDFSEKTNQILFSTPIKKRDFIWGRFLGACFVGIIPLLGFSLGNLIGSVWPWVDAERIGATYWSAHLNAITVFVIPNILFAGSIIFCIAALTRNTVTSFVGTIVLLVGYLLSQSLIRDLDNEYIGMLVDPFAIRTLSVSTKYWTVDDRNTMSMGYEGVLLLNRLIWLSVSVLVMIFTYYRFSFSEKSKGRASKKKITEDLPTAKISTEAIPVINPEFSSSLSRKQFFSQVKIEYLSILRNTAFIIILFLGMVNLIAAMFFVTDAGYGNKSFPVTYSVIDTIQGSLYLFIMSIITFYTGVIVWKERDAKVNDIYDALPFKGWIPMLSKTFAMWIVLEFVLIIAVLVGIITQTFYGFTDYKISVYVYDILIMSGLSFFFYSVLSILIHILVNNKYLAYFVFVAFVIANSFAWPAINIASNMVSFSSTPSVTYSDMNGFGPFTGGIIAFKTYWFLFSGILAILGIMFWVRGRETEMKIRFAQFKQRFKNYKPIFFSFLILWIISAGFVFYNTKVLNTYRGEKDFEKLVVDYEKKYKKYEGINQPRFISVKYMIDLFPAERKLNVNADVWIKNKGFTPVDSIHFNVSDKVKTVITIKAASLVLNDSLLGYRIYRLGNTLMPGDSLQLNITSKYAAQGFENEVSFTSIVENGSFFNNTDILPQIGYQPGNELSDRNKRKENALPEKKRMPELERNCTAHCMNTYITNDADWVDVETVFSTSADQIAIAPGSLIKEWKEGDRAYFHYRLDHFSLNFYSFISANYTVARDKYNGTDIEVYYIPEHKWNVKKMLNSMKNALAYYEKNYGPYYHKQTRIIEFPRYASFAQAFPGTMPYSEGIGFIANLEDVEDIDMVYYVVAHEMGHQWWAHQVTGAEMQGATLLSETMAQYSALMVMEKMYGKGQMHKFLRYEMDNYLRNRGAEREKETPLLKVENQGYVHYRKGSVVMYYLKEMIGEQAVNAALKNLIDSFAYRQPPYPNSYELVDRLDAQTPDSLKYLIKDLFYDITLFNNRTTVANYRKLPSGKYEVSFTITAEKLKADSLGKETKVPMSDWIEIAVLDEPADGKKYGKKIYSKFMKIEAGTRSFKVEVDKLPYQAGVDPDFYLIDRIPNDNLKKTTAM